MGAASRNTGVWLLATLATLLTFALAKGGKNFAGSNGTRKFELTITWEVFAPDGFPREMALINGGFPGPTLDINQGDDVEVLIHNKMPYNTTMHFHGIEQYLTPWSDGVPGISQRQVLPGESFLYTWTATQYGAYWYHAHQAGQLDDGLYGAITIHPKKSQATPFSLISQDDETLKAIRRAVKDVRPLILGDWRHIPSPEVHNITEAANMELSCYDSVLFNGKGSVECWPPERIAAVLSDQQKDYLEQANLTSMTPKGCLPAAVVADVISSGVDTHADVVPPSVFDVCTASSGGKEVIAVTKTAEEPLKWVALDLVGSFGLLTVTFSIDSLSVWVYAVDGEFIIPQLVQAITVTNGDRYGILVPLAAAGDYPIRIASTIPAMIIAGTATLSYRTEDPNAPLAAPTPYINDAGSAVDGSVVFYSVDAQKQLEPLPIASTAAQSFPLYMRTVGASFEWALNSSQFPAAVIDWGTEPVILFHPQPYVQNNVTLTTLNDTWIDLVFITADAPMPPHPIHKHGNKMWRIGHGEGEFTWGSVNEAIAAIPGSFNLVDPPRRDGFVTEAATDAKTWTAVRYHVTNPGAWLLHCHIQSHLLGGMAVVIQDGVDHWPQAPPEYLNY
ncbi:Cupredoxin [Lasiosphaeria hispida]|uniref:Cupredoxin n=1 Tax=Lasiosphaeria hispida TaxID=260671 RepID=A0AAJ0HP96_9PEZI|nr:Cupredoxin [Lasiosphaeria hispida]